ncbi:hypothetical protein Tsubulata_008599, partial [Turnera subulata]
VKFPRLTDVEITRMDHLEMIWHHRLAKGSFYEMKLLTIDQCKTLMHVFPSVLMRRLLKLEKLVISNCDSLEEIFQFQDRDNLEFQSLGEISIENCPNLKPICSLFLGDQERETVEKGHDQRLGKGYSDTPTAPHLNHELKILFPSSVSLRNLTDLDVSKCHGLLYLMNCSAAHCLLQLKRMAIFKCESIQEIMATEENEAELEVVFHKLEILALDSLPSLACFHLGKYALMFPSLWAILVKECPKMNIFSAGVTSTPKLEVVDLTVERDKWCWEGNLNDAIRKLFIQSVRIISQLYLTLLITLSSFGPVKLALFHKRVHFVASKVKQGHDAVEPEMPRPSQQSASALENTEADEIREHGPSEEPTYADLLPTKNRDTSGDLPSEHNFYTCLHIILNLDYPRNKK